MMKRISIKLIVIASIVLINQDLQARSFRVAQIPNGSVNGCANCHVSAGGGGTRTPFGELVLSSYLDAGGNVLWGPNLALEDADGDGYSNGHELEDPFGMWTSGSAAPGDVALVSFPGINTSIPPAAGQPFSLHFSLAGMTPHTGQLFQARLKNSSTDEEIAMEELSSIPDASFDLMFAHSLEAGQSYNLEFWSDHNGNGFYDPPPTDHAWRISISDVSDNTTTSFTHNTDFTDIGSPLSTDGIDFIRPDEMVLYDNFPNPFNPSTNLSFHIENSDQVEFTVFDIKGHQVASIYSGMLEAGSHHFTFDARDHSGVPLNAGVYLYRLQVGDEISTKRMTLLK